jgi:PAS domain S-box-containing protein
MKVKHSFFFIVLSLVVIIFLFFSLFSYFQKEQGSVLRESINFNHANTISSVLQLKIRSMDQIVFDYTYWDDMVNFVENRDMDWAEDNLSTMMESFHYDAVWVYSSSGKEIFSDYSPIIESQTSFSFPEELFPRLYSERTMHFYDYFEGMLFNISAATIHPTDDIERATEPRGFLLVGKAWDQEYIAEMERMTGTDIFLHTQQISLPARLEQEIFRHLRNFHGIDNELLMGVEFVKQYPYVSHFNRISNTLYYTAIIFVALIMLGFFYVFERNINKPLKLISNTLLTNKVGYLKPLLSGKNEFRDISLLIDEFFEQKTKLTEEINARKKTQQELKENQRVLTTLLDSLPGMAYRCLDDEQWTMIFVSEGSRELTGFSVKELLNNNKASYLDVIHPDDHEEVRAIITEAKAKKNRFSLTYRIVTKENKVKWVLEQGTGVFDDSGGFLFSEGFITEITTQKAAQEEITRSRDFYLTLFDKLPAMIWRSDPEGKIDYVNSKWQDFTGKKASDYLNNSYEADIEPVKRITVEKMHQDCFRQRASFVLEFKLQNSQGEYRWIRETGSPFYDFDGKFLGFIGACYDIHDKQNALTLIQESEERYKALFHNNKAIMYLFDSDSRKIVDANTAALAFYGYKPEQFIGMDVADINTLSTEELEREIQLAKKHEKGVFHFRQRLANGEIREVEIYAGLINIAQKTIIYSIVHDITARIKAEKAIEESEALLSDTFNTIQDGILIIDSDFRIKRTNDGMKQMYEMSPKEDLRNLQCYHLFGKNRELCEDCPAVIAMKDGKPQNKIVNISPEDQKPVYHQIFAYPMYDKDGNLTGAAVYSRDITHQFIYQEKLALEKERLLVTLRSIGDGVITTDTEGKVTMLNTIAEELTGWKADEAFGKHINIVFRIINEQTGDFCENPIDKVISSGQIVDLTNHTLLVSKDGSKRIIADSAAPILNAERTLIGVVLVFRDVTMKHKLEEELIKSQRFESIGTMAAGIAHDFNNLLGGVFGYIEMAKLFHKTPDKVEQYLNRALGVYERAKDLTRQLMTLSRGGSTLRSKISLSRLLAETAQFALSGSKTLYHIDLPNDLWDIEGDKNQLEQVFDNLLINAAQAMPEGGTITIQGENVPARKAPEWAAKHTDYVRIFVIDQGTGIPEDYIAQIFDPFFTTKQKGSGLGLATSYSIIKKHDGFFDVQSKMGEGSTFTITIPTCSENNSQKNTDTIT